MSITDSEITKLKKMVTAAQEEFDMAVAYHEVWKPAAYDKDLHSRMGQSYASEAVLVIRTVLYGDLFVKPSRLLTSSVSDSRLLRSMHSKDPRGARRRGQHLRRVLVSGWIRAGSRP